MAREGLICFALVLFSPLASPQPSPDKPLNFECRVAANGDGEAVITNQSASPLTAYVFQVLREPCNPIQANEQVFRGYDASTAPDGKSIPPFASTIQNLGASYCNKDGVTSPAKALLKAALFADGSSYGNKQWVEILLQHRALELQRIDGAISALISGTGRKNTRQEYVVLLEKAEASSNQPKENSPPVEFSDVDPYETAIRQLKANPAAPLQNQIDGLLAALQVMRSRIQNAHTSK